MDIKFIMKSGIDSHVEFTMEEQKATNSIVLSPMSDNNQITLTKESAEDLIQTLSFLITRWQA